MCFSKPNAVEPGGDPLAAVIATHYQPIYGRRTQGHFSSGVNKYVGIRKTFYRFTNTKASRRYNRPAINGDPMQANIVKAVVQPTG
jgi:hypothetical protein